MEKTAMQELIETLENFRGEIRERNDDDPLVVLGFTSSIAEAKRLLAKERQQIIDAYHVNPNETVWGNVGADYFKSKYGQ